MARLDVNELTGQAYEQVKKMILNGKLEPGQKIVQDSLALDLGISRTPLRSALQRLETEYLVKSIPRRGVVVREFTDENILEIYDCRIALECMAIRLFAESASEENLQKSKTFFADYRGDLTDVDEVKYKQDDIDFHDFILINCGNNFLRRLFQQGNLFVCIHQIGLVRPPSETMPEHIDIINAVCDRNADLAEMLCRQHLLKSRNLVYERIKSRKN